MESLTEDFLSDKQVRTVVFNHIPKTAGVSLRIVLSKALNVDDPDVIFDRSHMGTYDQFEQIDDHIRRMICLTDNDYPREPKFLVGHFSVSAALRLYPDAWHMIVFREARSRLLSEWMYLRSYTDEMFRPWGPWGEMASRARRPLEDFLSDRELACRTDNASIRILLWPHPLIPDDDYIDPVHDDAILKDAFEVLSNIEFSGFIENPTFFHDLSTTLKRDLPGVGTDNASAHVIPECRSSLADELSINTLKRMSACTRLDDALWRNMASRSLGPSTSEWLRDQTFAKNIARYAAIMGAQG